MDRRMLWFVALFLLMLCPFFSTADPVVEGMESLAMEAEATEDDAQEEALSAIPFLVYIPRFPQLDLEAAPSRNQESLPGQGIILTLGGLDLQLERRCADANGNLVLGGTYIASVPHAFALSDLPI